MNRPVLIGIAATILVIAVYAPFVGNGFLYDDFGLIHEPPRLTGLSDIPKLFGKSFYPTLAYYRPLSAAAYQVERALLGDSPAHFHAVNIGVAVLLLWSAAGFLRRACAGLPDGIAWAVAALFALHPVASSCVHAVSGRDTLIVAIWILLALQGWSRRGLFWYVLAVVSTGAALLTKEAAVSLPALLLAMDWLGLTENRPSSFKKWIGRYAPIVLIVAGYFVARKLMLSHVPLGFGSPLDVPLSYLYTLQVTLVPFRVLLYEPQPAAWLSWVRVVLVLAVLAGFAWQAVRAGSDLRRRFVFWGLWFVLTLLPSANLLAQETRFAERYALLPALAPLALLGCFVAEQWKRDEVRRYATAAAVLATALFCGIVVGRGPYWGDERFYRQWISHDSTRDVAFYNLANILVRQGELEEAIENYRIAAELAPHDGDAMNNLGAALILDRDFDGALAQFERAVSVAPRNAQAHNNLGQELARRQEVGRAIEHFQVAIRVDPQFADAYFQLGSVYVQRRQFAEAAQLFEQVVELEPDHAQAHNNLGSALASAGQLVRAMQHFQRASELVPTYTNAFVNMGHAAVALGWAEEAEGHFREALEQDEAYADAHYGLATALLALDRSEEALQELRQALQLQPDHHNAGVLLDRLEGR